MSLGSIASLARYPVKSMQGESLPSLDLDETGVRLDRRYALETSAAPPGMLRVSGRERRELLRYRAFCAHGGVLVETPLAERFSISDPALLGAFPDFPDIRLTHASRPQTDCRPLSLISLQTIRLLGDKLGISLDPRRFRANFYLNVAEPFEEDTWVGRQIRVGETATIRVLERDPRCRFITYDPDTVEPLPELMKFLHRDHCGRAGIYASIEVPGPVRLGDSLR